MAAPQDVVRVHRRDRSILVQVEGRVTMTHALALRRFAERCLAGGVAAMRVDLRQCTSLDSTFLGTLVFLKDAINSQGQGAFALVSPSPQCCRLLQQMALDDLFPIVAAEEPAPSDWMELESAREDSDAFRHAVVQAHEELANLPGPAGEPFRGVAHRLAQELGAKKPK